MRVKGIDDVHELLDKVTERMHFEFGEDESRDMVLEFNKIIPDMGTTFVQIPDGNEGEAFGAGVIVGLVLADHEVKNDE